MRPINLADSPKPRRPAIPNPSDFRVEMKEKRKRWIHRLALELPRLWLWPSPISHRFCHHSVGPPDYESGGRTFESFRARQRFQ
jgi:hypothetical protein